MIFVHQIFISHAKEDQAEASRICELLEADGNRCWLASRDATMSKDGGAAMLDAIRTADLVVLVFSASANASPGVLREIERAAAYKRPVLSVRVDNATPNVSLQHYLNLAPQPGALTPLDSLEKPAAGPAAEAAARRRRPSRKIWAMALGASAVAVALGLGLGLGLAGTDHQGVWTELRPAGSLPAERNGQSMVYDPSHGQVIMFGGATPSLRSDFPTTFLNETWTYDPSANTWTKLKPPGYHPSPRAGQAMAYDPVTHRLIMFGGQNENYAFLDGTWAYDPAANTWAELKPSGTVPAARCAHSMVYVPDTGKLVMFGGTGGAPQPVTPFPLGTELFNDTWAYDPGANTWTNLNPAGAVPEIRGFFTMAYDPIARKVILFGGATATALFSDTWAYDPAANRWTHLSPAGTVPAARGGQVMAYDPPTRKMLLFGGGSFTGVFDDVWAYDSAANAWKELRRSETVPSARACATMVCDPTTQRLILFGGVEYGPTNFNDTWAFST
jgi:N-acetylneuraminic acid mutarotase